MSQNRPQKRSKAHAKGTVPATSPEPIPATSVEMDLVADHHGYLAIGLAAVAMVFVALLTVMIMMAAT